MPPPNPNTVWSITKTPIATANVVINTCCAFCLSVTYILFAFRDCLISTAVTAMSALAKALSINALTRVVDLNPFIKDILNTNIEI